MKILRTLLLVLMVSAGLILAWFALAQAVADVRRVANVAPTDEVLETYAPNTGPLSRTALPQPTETSTLSPAATLTPPVPNSSLPGDSYLSALDPEPALARPTEQQPAVPTRIVIPAIKLDAPVTLAGSQKIRLGQKILYQWTAPDEFAAGWHTSSAYLGEAGNTVLNGHNNVHGAVFGNLFRLKNGDEIEVYSGDRLFRFFVTQTLVLEEANQPPEKRVENARWLSHSDDVRLTLVTCWPNDGNTHRLYVIAAPAQ